MSFIKNVVSNRDKTCSRCKNALGVRSHDPNDYFGLHFNGLLCNTCFNFIEKNTVECGVKCIRGFTGTFDGTLSIHLYDDTNKIILSPKDTREWFTITQDMITDCDFINQKESSLKRTIATAGLSKTKEKQCLQISFIDNGVEKCWVFDVGDKVVHVKNIICSILNNKPKTTGENNKTNSDSMSNLDICTVCKKNGYWFYSQREKLCSFCFDKTYGKIVLSSTNAEYYGGHKAYLAGGYFSKFQVGNLFLTDNSIIFVKFDSDLEKRWQITIPLKSIILSDWTVEEESRRKSVSAGGIGTNFGAFGAAFIHDEGKAHHIVIPYLDENGIPQTPRFGISSIGGKKIREWSAKIYEQIVLTKKNLSLMERQSASQPESRHHDVEDPLKILKIRYAKGEITKEDFDRMKSDIEN